MLDILKNTVYDKEKYLKEQENFSVLTNTNDIIGMMKSKKKDDLSKEFLLDEEKNENLETNNLEVIDFVQNKLDKILGLKGQSCQSVIDNLEEYTNYQKKYNLKRDDIHKNIVDSVEDKKKILNFNLGVTEFEEKYKWFLEQEENVELQKTNYSKLENMQKHWENEISALDEIDRNSYIENASLTLYASENRDFKEYVLELLGKKIKELEDSVSDNQKNFYFEKDFDKAEEIYKEETIIPKTDVNSIIEKINSDYTKELSKNVDMIEILSNIEEFDLKALKKDIERDRTEKVETVEDISRVFSDSIISKEILKNLSLVELGKIENFNFVESSNPELEINSKIERTVNVKSLDNTDLDFNKNDIKAINRDMKDLIKDRENANKYHRPYVTYEEFEKVTSEDYKEKAKLCKFLNTLDISDVNITPCKLNIENTGNEYLSSIVTPQYIASFETNKIGEEKLENILFDLAESSETKYNLDFLESVFGNTESQYDLVIRDTIRKLGENFYSDFIFNKDIGFGKTLDLSKEKVIYTEKSEIEKINDREKVIDIVLQKETEKVIEKEKTLEDNKNYEDDNNLQLNVYETREKVFVDLVNYPQIKDNLEILEENYTKDELYGKYENYQDNLNHSIELTVEYLIREELKLDKEENIDDKNAIIILENANINSLDNCLELFEKFKLDKLREEEKKFTVKTNYEETRNKVTEEKKLEKEITNKEREKSNIDEDYKDEDFGNIGM